LAWNIGGRWPGRIAKTIKGMFVALALVVALEREPDAVATLLALAGAVLAFLIGEIYDATIEAQIRNRRGLMAAELGDIAYEESFIVAGAIPAMVIFGFASAGLLSTSVADNVTIYTGVALLGCLGVAAGRLARQSPLRCLVYGVESAAIGGVVVLLKVLVKKI
jgi:hypothetical protein